MEDFYYWFFDQMLFLMKFCALPKSKHILTRLNKYSFVHKEKVKKQINIKLENRARAHGAAQRGLFQRNRVQVENKMETSCRLQEAKRGHD